MEDTYLDQLEAEAIFILREAVVKCKDIVMLYSIGKDSAVMLHLAQKAFYPEEIPFPLLHIDTTWKFKEMIDFRNRLSEQSGIKLLTYTNISGLKAGINPFSSGSAYTDIMKTQALKQALKIYGFQAAIGGARREEEKSRAKERVFSYRNEEGAWNPRRQRIEVWRLYNTRLKLGESLRIFPLSNWTELDIWRYIKKENIKVVPLYFSKLRPTVLRNGNIIMVDDERLPIKPDECIQMRKIRFRTLGCYPLTGGFESDAQNVDEIIDELQSTRFSERNSRLIDFEIDGSLERRKREGYF